MNFCPGATFPFAGVLAVDVDEAAPAAGCGCCCDGFGIEAGSSLERIDLIGFLLKTW